MLNIRPRTYNEALCLFRCEEIRKYVPNLTDEQLKEMYTYLRANSANRISVTNEMVTFLDRAGGIKKAYPIEVSLRGLTFHNIIIGAKIYRVTHAASSFNGGGYGGCSSNNNNNNNNNNG